MEKKYIKNFESFKNSSNEEPVNEEAILGKLFNFFKNIFKKAQDKLKALTSFDDVKNYYKTKLLAPKSSETESIFSAVLKEYEAKPGFNDQDCFDLVAKMIDPDNNDCVLNSKNIQTFVAGFGDEKTKKEEQYIMETVRNKTLVALKYGGTTATSFVVGKALPVPAIPLDKKNVAKNGNVFAKKDHLPKLKEKIVDVADGAAKKKAGLDFVRDILIPQMIGFCNLITEEEVDKFSGADVEEVGVLGSYGVKEEKELVGKDIYYMMDGYDAKAPKKELIGKGKVMAFDETKGFSIETEKGNKFDKTVDKLLSKVDAEKLLGIEESDVDPAKKAAEELALIKDDPNKMKNVSSYAQFLNKAKPDDVKTINDMIEDELDKLPK